MRAALAGDRLLIGTLRIYEFQDTNAKYDCGGLCNNMAVAQPTPAMYKNEGVLLLPQRTRMRTTTLFPGLPPHDR